MVSTDTPSKEQPAEEKLRSTCPYCLSDLDVHLDVKGRPYWRCWRCEVRSFGTKTAHKTLEANGWIWSNERPLKALKAWLRRLIKEAGLRKA